MSDAVQPFPRISPEESRRRADAVRFARGSVRLEGINTGPEMAAVSDRFISGEYSADEYTQAVKALDPG